jgi:hypothetical protein
VTIRSNSYDMISDSCLDGLIRYCLYGDEVGGFLTAVLLNDLREAACRADDQNIQILHVYASWLHNTLPNWAWGSDAAMTKWRDARTAEPFSAYYLRWPDQRSEDMAREISAFRDAAFQEGGV